MCSTRITNRIRTGRIVGPSREPIQVRRDEVVSNSTARLSPDRPHGRVGPLPEIPRSVGGSSGRGNPVPEPHPGQRVGNTRSRMVSGNPRKLRRERCSVHPGYGQGPDRVPTIPGTPLDCPIIGSHGVWVTDEIIRFESHEFAKIGDSGNELPDRGRSPGIVVELERPSTRLDSVSWSQKRKRKSS